MTDDVAFLRKHPAVQAAWTRVRELDEWTLERQIELTEIPAPTFQEGRRAAHVAELFSRLGLAQVRYDELGNVLADLPPHPHQSFAQEDGPAPPASSGSRARSPFVVSAHLDTVFEEGTEVRATCREDRIEAPGICDNGRGLAALLTLARVLVEERLPLSLPLRFAATVGEEGAGDLRGVRHLFGPQGEGREAVGFLSLDGVGLERIIHRGVGSVRLRITLRGPGGHSWSDFGRPNPIHRLGKTVAALAGLPLPDEPRSTLTVARWGGGHAINAIPEEAWIEVDLRSQDPASLEEIEAGARAVCQEAGAAGPLQIDFTELGRRPAGATPSSDPLVEAAVRATRSLGVEPHLAASSSDANIPMTLGIPAVTLGAGGEGGGVHTVGEWYRNHRGPEGVFRALLVLLLLHG